MGIFALPAERYHDVYLIFVTLFSIFAINNIKINTKKTNDFPIALVICLFFVYFLGTRPISVLFGDMPLYNGIYLKWSGQFVFDWTTTNVLFDNLEFYLASIQFDPTLHYILFAGIYFGCMLIACKKLFPQHVTFAFLCCCAAFSTFSYCVNGYKAGSAAAFFLIALAYRDNLKIAIPFVLISWGFHHSMQLPVVAFVVTQLYSKPKYYYYLWLLCAILSIFHVSYFQKFFAELTDEQGASYLMKSSAEQGFTEAYKSGFRFDFWIYSAMPVLVGWWSINKFKIEDKFYNKLLCMYLMVNSIWLLCIYAEFCNRIAYLSWFMYAIVLIYPLFNPQLGSKRSTYLKYTATLHLAFTLFMNIVYHN